MARDWKTEQIGWIDFFCWQSSSQRVHAISTIFDLQSTCYPQGVEFWPCVEHMCISGFRFVDSTWEDSGEVRDGFGNK